MSKPTWEQNWTIEETTATVARMVVNADGKAKIKLTAHYDNHRLVYYSVDPINAPYAWRDVLLFPRGSGDVPNTFKFLPPDPGPLGPNTSKHYLTQAIDIQADIEQDLNNLRLEGDLNLETIGRSTTVTMCLVRREVDPTDWCLVLYVHGGANPDGAGVGHH